MSQRHIDTILPSVSLQKIHVLLGGDIVRLLLDVEPLVSQLVLDLKEDHIPAIRDEVRRDGLGNLPHVGCPGLRVPRVVVAELPVLARRHPEREPSRIGLSIDVRTGADDHVHAELLGQGHDRGEVVRAVLEVENPR